MGQEDKKNIEGATKNMEMEMPIVWLMDSSSRLANGVYSKNIAIFSHTIEFRSFLERCDWKWDDS